MTDIAQTTQASPLRLIAEGFLDAFMRWSPPPSPVAPSGVWSRSNRLRRVLANPIVPWVLALAAVAISIVAAGTGPPPEASLVGVITAIPVVAAFRNTLAGWRLAMLGVLVLIPFAGDDNGLWMFPVLNGILLIVLTALVAASYPRPTALWVVGTTALVMILGSHGNSSAWLLAAGAVAIVADVVRSRRLTAQALVAAQEVSGLERARRISYAERTRIARELHDVVAHHMSIVAVRAETAPYRLEGLSDALKEEFAEISAAARSSLNEIRSVLGVLRSDEASLTPQPGLGELEEMIEATRRAGVEVELVVRGDRRTLRPAVELAAYRILQEALANVARHAPGARLDVWIEYGADTIGLVVANPWEGDAGVPGHGITGMAERAGAVGGVAEARRRPDGRFVVEASLPVVVEEIG